MHITFTPQDGDRQEWDIDLADIPTREGELIEGRYGQNFGQWAAGVQSGNAKARRVLVWWLQRREHHTLRIEDMPDFRFKDVQIEYSVAELEEMREQLGKIPDPADRDKAAMQIDMALSDAVAREAAAEHSGKASSAISVTDGGTPSPQS